VPRTPSTTVRVRVAAHDAAGHAGAGGSVADVTIDTWTITASAGAHGTVAPAGAVAVAEADSQRFTLTPAPGYHLAGVLVDGAPVGTPASWTFHAAAADHAITAGFAIDSYALLTAVAGGGGVTRVPDQPSYAYGDSVTLLSSPEPGWVFVGWSGDTSATADPLGLIMTRARSVTASYADTAAPAVRVVAPNGGEAFTVGSPVDLVWTASDNDSVTAVDLLLSRAGGGGPWESLASGVPNLSPWRWSASGPVTGDARFRVVAHDAAGHGAPDASDAGFAIADRAAVESPPPSEIELLPPQPNPARGQVRIPFALPRAGRVTLDVVDVQGRDVARLVAGELAAGRHEATWRASGATGAGLYFVRLEAGGRTRVRRLALVR
jgi:hypothetical protein